MDNSAVAKFLAECSDLHNFLDKTNETVDLLDLEVGALLRRQDFVGDGPSDVSLQVLQEARSIRKSQDANIRESSELAKNMDSLLKELLEKVKQSYKQTEEMEKYMVDYGYEIPAPLEPALFEIFRDRTAEINGTAIKNGQAEQQAENIPNFIITDTSEQDISQEGSGVNSSAQESEMGESESDLDILDKTDSDAPDDIEATETKLKPNSKGKISQRERYKFQTSVISTPVQKIEFSKKAINFQNSYLFQSPSLDESARSTTSVLPQNPPEIVSNSPPKSSIYSILKPAAQTSSSSVCVSSSSILSTRHFQSTNILESIRKVEPAKYVPPAQQQSQSYVNTAIPGHVRSLLSSAKKPKKPLSSMNTTVKTKLEYEDTMDVKDIEMVKNVVPVTPVKSSNIDEMETPEHLRNFLKDLKIQVRKDKENMDSNEKDGSTNNINFREETKTLSLGARERQSILAPGRVSSVNISSKPKVRQSIMKSDLLAIIGEGNKRIEEGKHTPPQVEGEARQPSGPVQKAETPVHIREFLKNLGR